MRGPGSAVPLAGVTGRGGARLRRDAVRLEPTLTDTCVPGDPSRVSLRPSRHGRAAPCWPYNGIPA